MSVIATDLSQNSAFEFNQSLIIHTPPYCSAIAWIGSFFLSWFLIWIPIAVPLSRQLKWQPFHPLTPSQKLPLVASLYAIVPLLLLSFPVLEGNSFSEYGLDWHPAVLRSTLLSTLIGIGIALLGLLLLFSIQQWQTWSCWQPVSIPQLQSVLLPSLLLGLWIGTTEELVFRGFLLNHCLLVLPGWGAAIASSLMFALLHLIWERQQTVPQLPGLWLMGMVLVLARWADQGLLGLAIGLHAGWVGGMISLDSADAIHYSDRAPAWFTGVYHHPLAGVGGLLLLLLTGSIVYILGKF